MTVVTGPDAEPKLGNCLPLAKIPTGMDVHNVEMQPGGGAKMCRSAGTSATLTAREGDLGPAHPALRRGPPRPGHVPGDDRPGRQLAIT